MNNMTIVEYNTYQRKKQYSDYIAMRKCVNKLLLSRGVKQMKRIIKKVIEIVCIGSFLFVIASCNQKETNTTYDITEIENVTVTIKDGTLNKNGMTVIVSDENGRGRNGYSQWYVIEKKNNESWQEQQRINNNNVIIDDIEYLVNSEGILELELNWDGIYEQLTEGVYRLVLSVNEYESINTSDSKVNKSYISMEFSID